MKTTSTILWGRSLLWGVILRNIPPGRDEERPAVLTSGHQPGLRLKHCWRAFWPVSKQHERPGCQPGQPTPLPRGPTQHDATTLKLRMRWERYLFSHIWWYQWWFYNCMYIFMITLNLDARHFNYACWCSMWCWTVTPLEKYLSWSLQCIMYFELPRGQHNKLLNWIEYRDQPGHPASQPSPACSIFYK